MTDLPPITDIRDTWVNSATNRRGQDYGSTPWVHMKSGERCALLRWPLRGVRGRPVLTAPLFGRVGPDHGPATYTIEPIIEGWSVGDVSWPGPAVNAAATIDVEITDTLDDGDLIEFDITPLVESVAAGADWYGVRITTDSATAQKFYATDSGKPAWEHHITLSEAPEQPTNPRPDGGPIGDAEAILAYDYVHLAEDGADQAKLQIQVDFPTGTADPDPVTPDFDTGWVATPDPQYDLAADAGFVYAGQPRICWRARVEDADGHQSEWMDWAEYSVDPMFTLVVDSPTGPFGDPEPTILAHIEGGTLTHWDAVATMPDRSDIRLRTGVKTGTIEWTLPVRAPDGRRVIKRKKRRDDAEPDLAEILGWVRLRAWDDVERVEAVGQPVHATVWIPLQFDDDLTVVAPENLTVAQIEHGDPRHAWQFEHTEVSDAYLFGAGSQLLARVEPEDMEIDAGVYSWNDNGQIPPMRSWELWVRAVEGNQRSTPATYDAEPYVAEGFWFLSEVDDIDAIVLDGTSVRDFLRTDRVATFEPLEGPEIDIIYDTPPRKGTFDGQISSVYSDVWATIDAIDALSASANRRGQAVWGSKSQYARAADADATPDDDIDEDNLLHRAVVRIVGLDD